MGVRNRSQIAPTAPATVRRLANIKLIVRRVLLKRLTCFALSISQVATIAKQSNGHGSSDRSDRMNTNRAATPLHAMPLEYFFTWGTQLCAILLQALLNRVIVA